jgi:hypothetical protein
MVSKVLGQARCTWASLFNLRYSYKPYSDSFMTNFLEKGNFDRFCDVIHVHADYDRFETTLMFYIWAFMVSTINSAGICTVLL